MERRHDWKALVRRHARASGAADLPAHTVEELAAHLEDLYAERLRAGATDAEAYRAAEAALAESPLAVVPRPRRRAAGITSRQRGVGRTRSHRAWPATSGSPGVSGGAPRPSRRWPS